MLDTREQRHMTPAEIDRRVMKGRRALAAWRRQASQPSSGARPEPPHRRGASRFASSRQRSGEARREGNEIAAAQITAELGALEGLAAEARRIGRPEKAAKIEALIARYA